MKRSIMMHALIHSAAAIRTWDHRYYINLGDGDLYERGKDQRVPLAKVYPCIRTAFNSQHQPIARRKQPQARLLPIPSKPL